MRQQIVIFMILFSVIIYFSNVGAQDDRIVFPGSFQRPYRPTQSTKRPATQNRENTTTNNGVSPSIQEYNNCVRNCPVTSEYNPICGSDGVVYWNPGSLGCAQRCGNSVVKVKNGQCIDNQRG